MKIDRHPAASLATMLLGKVSPPAEPRSPTSAPASQSLPEGELRRYAEYVAADFRCNVGKPQRQQPPRKLSHNSPLSSVSAQSNYLGLPAFAVLGYGGEHQGPLRSKAFSMQVHESACRSEEKKTAPSQASVARLGSPQISPSKRLCVRSLLLEPDMEDLNSIWPRTTDLNDELNCPDEEDEHDDRDSEHETDLIRSRESCFSESIFCSGPLSALSLTQAV